MSGVGETIMGIPAAVASMFGASGAAGAASGAAEAIPNLLTASAIQRGAASIPQGLTTALLGPANPALKEAFSIAPDMVNQAIGPSSAVAPPPATPPYAPTGGIVSGGAPPGVPPIQPQPAWKEALASTALVGAQAGANRGREPTAPAPHLFIPQGVRPPQVGSAVPRGLSPLQRYAAMLRRI